MLRDLFLRTGFDIEQIERCGYLPECFYLVVLERHDQDQLVEVMNAKKPTGRRCDAACRFDGYHRRMRRNKGYERGERSRHTISRTARQPGLRDDIQSSGSTISRQYFSVGLSRVYECHSHQ